VCLICVCVNGEIQTRHQSNDTRSIQHIYHNHDYLYVAMSKLVSVRVHGVESLFNVVSVSVNDGRQRHIAV